MNMHTVVSFSAMDMVVGSAVLFALVFLVAWLASPKIRLWVERPKYRFQTNLQSYDQASLKDEGSNLL